MQETGFTDMTGRKITFHSILLNSVEKMYFIVTDPELGICIQDTRRILREKLTKQVAKELRIYT